MPRLALLRFLRLIGNAHGVGNLFLGLIVVVVQVRMPMTLPESMSVRRSTARPSFIAAALNSSQRTPSAVSFASTTSIFISLAASPTFNSLVAVASAASPFRSIVSVASTPPRRGASEKCANCAVA